MFFEIQNLKLDIVFIWVCLPLLLTHPFSPAAAFSMVSKEPLPSWEKKTNDMFK